MHTELTEEVKKAIASDGRIVSKHIHVSANDGMVEIHGIVDSLEEFGLVQEVAESVPGVNTVTNGLEIEGEVNKGPCCPQM